ncbi:hypothetical protein L3V83_04420 [Thiotrichales bacterium 19X7-9]|nr:hypothetical protein [Thiotrichales bacterium 19X7-9]
MDYLNITLEAIDQYIKQYKESISKQVTGLYQKATGEQRARHLLEILYKIKENNANEEFTNRCIKKFIRAYLLNNIRLMSYALQESTLAYDNVDFELLSGGGNGYESLRPILSYTLALITNFERLVMPDQFYQLNFNKEKVKEILFDFATPVTCLAAEKRKGGKKKYFDAATGFVYVRDISEKASREILEEFKKESELEAYVLAYASRTKEFALLEMLSFQRQDPLNPYRAQVAIYLCDHENYFGFETLDDFIAQAQKRQYSYKQLLQIVMQIFDITHQLWLAGISHQDFHMGNIKIIPDGPYENDKTNFKVQLFDFGNAQFNLAYTDKALLVDWNYLLFDRSNSYSDGFGRSFVSCLPLETDVNKKHYPIDKLVSLLDPEGKLTTYLTECYHFFINSLKYAVNKDMANYAYQNFKYNILFLLKEKRPVYRMGECYLEQEVLNTVAQHEVNFEQKLSIKDREIDSLQKVLLQKDRQIEVITQKQIEAQRLHDELRLREQNYRQALVEKDIEINQMQQLLLQKDQQVVSSVFGKHGYEKTSSLSRKRFNKIRHICDEGIGANLIFILRDGKRRWTSWHSGSVAHMMICKYLHGAITANVHYNKSKHIELVQKILLMKLGLDNIQGKLYDNLINKIKGVVYTIYDYATDYFYNKKAMEESANFVNELCLSKLEFKGSDCIVTMTVKEAIENQFREEDIIQAISQLYKSKMPKNDYKNHTRSYLFHRYQSAYEQSSDYNL